MKTSAKMLYVLPALLLSVPLGYAETIARQPEARIGYLTLSAILTHEDSSAIAWIKGSGRGEPVLLNLETAQLTHPGVDLVWIHIPDSAGYANWRSSLGKLRPLREFYFRGGKLLLTDVAGALTHELGFETGKPEIRPLSINDDWSFDEKGIQGFRGHPVFDGLAGGVFLWDSNVDNIVFEAGFFGNRVPRDGKVVGIEKSYVVIESDNKLLIEYGHENGRCLSVGAFVCFGRPNSMRAHLELFMSNVLGYLLGSRSTTKPTYWVHAENKPRQVQIHPSGRRVVDGYWIGNLPSTGLLFKRENPADTFFDLAGRRALVMGRENGGIDEFWVYPFRVLRDYRAGLIIGDSVLWLKDQPASLEIRPESLTRKYATPAGLLEELVFPSLERGGAVVHYAMHAPITSASLLITWRSDLRWMWPYDERALGDVYYGYDDSLCALRVNDLSGDFACVMGSDRPPAKRLTGQFETIRFHHGMLIGVSSTANQVFHAAMYDLGRNTDHALTISLVGTDEGEQRALADYRALLARPEAEYARLVGHYNDLLRTMVTIESPDSTFNNLWKWTLIGVDRFVATTPALGTALVAGFSTVDRGWDGGHKISGRPGYAWYFGRDAEWSGFALDDEGDFATVRQEIEFLQKFQDITGKIFHELSTSGVVHYDAADSTPLYIVLAAHYLRASGDLEFIRKSWPHLEKAMDFLYSTDTDGDLLIENSNVGHGWVEGGKLWPVHTEMYLAGIWGQALADASWMATLLGRTEQSAKYARDAEVVKNRIDHEFWNPSTGVFAYGKLKDGSFNWEPTVLPAPVMYFGWLDENKVRPMLAEYAGNSFTTSWGVRILRGDSPLYDPRGYHSGAVWPLFTGWTALAEYAYGNSVQAFSHLLDNLSIAKHWEPGFVQEVLDGSLFKPSGVCPHQCWSETNIIHPGVHGMIGWNPDATSGLATLNPRFPANWNDVIVHNLRVGESFLEMRLHRSLDSTAYEIRLTYGPSVHIRIAPQIPEGMEIDRAWVNRDLVPVTSARKRGLLGAPVEFVVRDSCMFSFHHTGGIVMIPLVSEAEPGDSAVGKRLIASSLNGESYTIDLEGRPGTTEIFRVMVFNQRISAVEGARRLPQVEPGIEAFNVSFPNVGSSSSRARVVVRLNGR